MLMDRALQRVEDLFENRTLLRPTEKQPNTVHLVRALASVGGVTDLEMAEPARQLAGLIGETEHLVFVLLDGLGMNVVRRLPPEAFLVRTLQAELTAIAPSTTACALTTIATADYPGRHGVTGWFTHLPEFELTMTTLPFVERFTNKPLAERGIKPEDVLPLPAFQSRMSRDSLTLLPYVITHTTYANYSRGYTPGHGYASAHHAVDITIEHVKVATRPTYTHLYLPDVDAKCHHVGVNHPDVVSLVMQLDAEMARLSAALKGRARIVITADHGLIDVPREKQTLLQSDDPLLQLLAVPPSGDARMPVFHVKAGRHEQFVDAFNRRFGDGIILLDIDSADRLRLFCPPAPLADHAKRRFGDFVGIAHKPATLAFHPPGKPIGHLYLALHAGLSPQEMQVPLMVA
jgi:hypothetical protein